MRLYHFTAGEYLQGIARHGLTVGDVPTDLATNRGLCGVWLTSSENAGGHGLSSSAIDKMRYRLSIDCLEHDPKLHCWANWSAANASAATIQALGKSEGDQAGTWWVYFGVIPPGAIVSCVDMSTGEEVIAWGELTGPLGEVLPGVPAWRRDAWHKALLKKVQRAIAAEVGQKRQPYNI